MKIILLGSNGMLGSYLKTYLADKYDVLALTRKDIDFSVIDDFHIIHSLQNIVKKGDIIINACGVIKQREYNVSDMIMVNSILPNILAKIKEKIGCEVIHITTDCVFNGNKGNYIESDKHDCTDDYGKSKSLGENPILTNIRTSIIGEEKNNKKSLLEWVRSNEGKTIDGYYNHLWNGVTCLELAKYIDSIIETKNYWLGVRHVFSPDTVSKYDLVSYINDIYKLGITINKKSTSEPCYRNLSSDFLEPTNKTLYEQILELKEYDNN
jgi:dTDP-4-dehydrorhamnose reductase